MPRLRLTHWTPYVLLRPKMYKCRDLFVLRVLIVAK